MFFPDTSDSSKGSDGAQSELGEIEKDDTDTEDNRNDKIVDNAPEREGTASTETDTTDGSIAAGSGTEGNDDSDAEETNSGSNSGDSGIDFGTTTGRRNVQQTLNDTQSIIIRVNQSAYEMICQEVGLDHEEATANEVGQAIIEQNLNIQSFIDSDDGA